MSGRPSKFKTGAARTNYCRLYDEAIALSPVRVEESDVQTSFGTTHVLTAGDPSKPPLVALHGMSISSTMWLPLLAMLTASHHVRMLDTVGDINKSVATGVMSSPARVVEWIDEVLDTLTIERSAFLSASTGSWVGTHYAMARPGRVERLAMVCPAGIVSPQHTRWLLGAILKCSVRPTRAKVETFLDSLAMETTRPQLRTDPWRPIAQQFIMGIPSFRMGMREPRPVRCNIDRLAASGIPVLAIIGRDETLHDGATMAKRFRQQLPQAQVELLDDASHLLFIDQPEAVAEHLRTFLRAD
jgi:pimeloyl-ACP methyl ester carboxylesterase